MELIEIINNLGPLAVICFIAGFILVVIEMFHPGFGAPGISGGILLIAGVVMTATTVAEGLIMTLIILTILGFILMLVLQSATKGRLSKKLILNEAQKKESGYIGTEDLEYFLGKEGIALSVLRPSGTADFDGVKVDVVSEGDYIQNGTKVKVIMVQGRRIVVKGIIK